MSEGRAFHAEGPACEVVVMYRSVGCLLSLGCIDRWVRGRGVLRIGRKDADCKIVLVAYSV